MLLNDIWHLFNKNIQSQESTDWDRKQSAINLAQTYLVQRCIQEEKVPDQFISNPTNISNSYGYNYVTLPSDFLSINQGQLWRQQTDGTYWPFGEKAVITYDDLLTRTGTNFFNSSDIAEPMVAAIKKPNLYFDHYLSNNFIGGETLTGATSLATSTVENTSITLGTGVGTVSISGISGTYQVGEVISGSSSGTIGTVTDQNTQTLTIWNKFLSYQVGETLTGGTSGATGTITALPVSNKIVIQVLSGTFELSEVVTGGTSTAHSTILTMTDDTMAITITGSTNKIKMGYVKMPTDIVVYDKLNLTSVSGTFQVGEIVVGGTSNANGIVLLVFPAYIGLKVNVGTFHSSETITGQISGATASVSGSLVLKPATLSWGVEYKTLLIEACGLMYHRLKNSNEVSSRSDIVDNMIEMMGVTNNNSYCQWGMS